MHISADTNRCIGTGQCSAAAPAVFSQTDDGLVTVLMSEPAESMRADVEEAALTCPVRCITVS